MIKTTQAKKSQKICYDNKIFLRLDKFKKIVYNKKKGKKEKGKRTTLFPLYILVK